MLRIVILLLAVTSLLATATTLVNAQDDGPIPGGVYEAFSEDAVGCDQGDIQNSGGFALRLNAEGTRVVEIVSFQTSFMGSYIGTVSLPADVPIGPDGSYSEPILFPPIVISGEGRFIGETVTGSFRVELNGVLECDGTFAGDYVGQQFDTYFYHGATIIGLGQGGTGPTASANSLVRIVVLLSAAGLLAIGAGAALRVRRTRR